MDVVYFVGGSAMAAIEFGIGLTRPSTRSMILGVVFLIIAIIGYRRLRRRKL
ncbi:MAG: hypothetical protein ABSB12_02760 [Candidatus Saccharimonadales bacterium]|jgi:hypothetical protein